ncbi:MULTISPECIES: BMC domain-containing protein [Anaerotruncus]|jgi:microcompartment protein CcmL/EutN|uniref:BMC domain-containing protein n=1 Tax=Anaerotruncus colihominis TaxID=169435 RepID=A0A845RHB7_9FIRM|nr:MULTISPECIES: BMC domain-containing protein [Anaerotruncus]MCI8493393.1 BMC domain-containing protein [Anaerotruncus sp.]MCR2025563.1 BMC domain-containing protein [Anaerotruncus colihominis]NBI78225.1 BMC domain-containing protein [Anaerotruncus colihominis]NDO39724.1 BMC domain-containing protein [Anaerotruncus colihominis]
MNALGMIELTSIPAGVQAGDAMLKAAAVELVTAQPVCAGKYIVLVTGEAAAVRESVEAGKLSGGEKLVDSMFVANIHPQVPRAINACTEIERVASVGVMEVFSLCAAVLAADAAAKAADVQLMEVRLGRGLGGKSFIALTGEIASVQAAVDAARAAEGTAGLMNDSVVIPAPHPDMIRSLY